MGDSYMAGSVLVLAAGAVNMPESAVLRGAVAALGTFGGAGFQPSGARSARFLGGEGEAVTVALKHPAYPAANSWVQLMLGDADPGASVELFLTVHLDEPDPLGPEWEMALSLATQLVTGLGPSLAHLTAWHVDSHEPSYASRRLLPGSVLPEEFGPWTYVSGAGLTDQLRERLAALPAHASRPLGDGWLVRAVEHPGDEPADSLHDALDTLGPDPIAYRPARLTAG
ncbi:hypothetical protein V5P93_002204 [Actinokineospora auranticolor]|uniref:Uncharacterized protein n=1 Tax=Actinokineospora auranticolor TaxID=155976 RepID=A0A2S6GEP5_9PSEU|nr:hypothetical protein [Actinokineospora auranticolor]PPK63707.1 hypothetical protein CLV40_12542 [Actinokineospora auranticolor]